MRNKLSRFKNFILVAGFLTMLGLGYITTSVMTSCTANADACTCSICVYAAGGLTTSLTALSGGIVIPAIAVATGLITAYYAIAAAAFAAQAMGKFYVLANDFMSWINSFWDYALRPSLQLQTSQLNTMDSDQARTWSGFADATDMARTRQKMMVMEAESHREARPGENVCVAGSVAGGMVRATNFRRAYNAAAPVERAKRTTGGTGTAAAKGRAADQLERWNNYVAKYCDATANNGHAGCASDGSFPGADLDVTGQIFQKDTIDLKDDDVRKTVDDLIINIAEPFTKDVLPAGLGKSAGGRQAILEGEEYKAKRQVIYDALYYVVARRAPGSTMQSVIKPIREAAGIPAAQISANPSPNEVMEVMMSERFRSGQYSVNQIDEPENNERELAIQQAFQVMTMSDQLDLLDKYSLLLAANIGYEVQHAKPLYTAAQSAPTK